MTVRSSRLRASSDEAQRGESPSHGQRLLELEPSDGPVAPPFSLRSSARSDCLRQRTTPLSIVAPTPSLLFPSRLPPGSLPRRALASSLEPRLSVSLFCSVLFRVRSLGFRSSPAGASGDRERPDCQTTPDSAPRSNRTRPHQPNRCDPPGRRLGVATAARAMVGAASRPACQSLRSQLLDCFREKALSTMIHTTVGINVEIVHRMEQR